MILELKVTPKSSSNQIVGWEGSILKVRIKGVPEDNEVNTNLIEFLSNHFNIPKIALSLISGKTSRIKRINIDEKWQEAVKFKLMLIF